MADDLTLTRALRRYGDTLYRLALLLDARDGWAARATAAAFVALQRAPNAEDERVLSILLRALPTPGRGVRPGGSPLPPTFWKLPPHVRLALGLRLMRDDDWASIAVYLDRPAPELRRAIVEALARLGGADPAAVPEACLANRALRLETPAAGAAHLRFCVDCREDGARRVATEAALAAAIPAAVGHARLPWTVEATIGAGMPAATPAGPLWRPLALLIAAVSLLVLALVGRGGYGGDMRHVPAAGVEAPRRLRPAAEQAGPDVARTLVRRAFERYGAVPTGSGVTYRRYRLGLGEAQSTVEAETWFDAGRPGRYRMQLIEAGQVLEWQAGDGAGALRYFAVATDQLCGPNYAGTPLATGVTHAWTMAPAQQVAFWRRRWQSGPWASGGRYLAQALHAPRLRLLGNVDSPAPTTVTLLADELDGGVTLLLKLALPKAELLEVRELRTAGGGATVWTPWSMIVDGRSEQGSELLDALPTANSREPINHSAPPLDPACPLVGVEQTASPVKLLGWGRPSVIGFATPPPATERGYLLAWPGASNRSGSQWGPDIATLVYHGPAKRIALTAMDQLRQESNAPMRAGPWLVQLRSTGADMFQGEARPSAGGAGFSFFADGWSRAALLDLLATARPLDLTDVVVPTAHLLDPDPPPPSVAEYTAASLEWLRAASAGAQYSVLHHTVRERPAPRPLADPYHAQPHRDTIETWVDYGPRRNVLRFHGITRNADGRTVRIEWGDAAASQRWDLHAGLLERFSGTRLQLEPAALVEQQLRNIFRYEQFWVEHTTPEALTFEATLPITATELAWGVRAQRRREANAAEWPWVADLDPQSVTYRATFDRRSKHPLAFTLHANNRSGATLVEALQLEKLAAPLDPLPTVWIASPPPHLPVIDVKYQEHVGRLPVGTVVNAAYPAVPGRLWGWPTDRRLQLTRMNIPSATTSQPATWSATCTLSGAVAAGLAAEMQYAVANLGQATLVQGSSAWLGAQLRRCPAWWVASRQRTIPIAGEPRTAWLMRGDDAERWAVFELGDTLAILRWASPQLDNVILPMLARLQPLHPSGER